jgi:NAD(P)H dehydrogenase (quinone)
MITVGIVHHSSTGYTRLLADAVAEGVSSVGGAKAERLAIAGADIVEGRYGNDALLGVLDGCDAIVFGTPTYMGSVSAQTKAFLDASLRRWYSRAWSGKVAAGFTVSSTPSGDKLNALTDLMICALQHGMIWVGQDESPMNAEGVNRLGCYLGAVAQPDYAAKPPALVRGDAASGERLGARVARITAALVAGRS